VQPRDLLASWSFLGSLVAVVPWATLVPLLLKLIGYESNDIGALIGYLGNAAGVIMAIIGNLRRTGPITTVAGMSNPVIPTGQVLTTIKPIE
jgi:hypothetical protein